MIWKLLGLQKKLDALFCDGWLVLGYARSGSISADALGTHEASQRHA